MNISIQTESTPVAIGESERVFSIIFSSLCSDFYCYPFSPLLSTRRPGASLASRRSWGEGRTFLPLPGVKKSGWRARLARGGVCHMPASPIPSTGGCPAGTEGRDRAEPEDPAGDCRAHQGCQRPARGLALPRVSQAARPQGQEDAN